MQYSLKSAIKFEISQSQSQYHKHNFTLMKISPHFKIFTVIYKTQYLSHIIDIISHTLRLM
jgi:hypothetical protein